MVFDYPKILHLIWRENFDCSFPNYITAISFQKHHPDWKIYIYYYDDNLHSNRHWKLLQKDSRVYMKNAKDILEGLGFYDTNLVPEQKNDIVKIYALETVGGVYSDFDIIYLKNIEEMFGGYKSDMILFYDNSDREKIVFDFAISKRVISPTRPTFQELQKNICRGSENLVNINCLGSGMFTSPENYKFREKIALLSDINYKPITLQNAETLLLNVSSIEFNLFALKWWDASQVDKKYLGNTKKYLYSCIDKIVSPYKIIETVPEETIEPLDTTKKISIVMAYINRLDQLTHTLNTISKSAYKNIEVIIVDDGSIESEKTDRLIDYYDFEIKLIVVKESEKDWVNPCIPYNIGLSKVSGDIVIIQNPEVCHVGDILSYCAKYANDSVYLTFSVISSASPEDNKKIYDYMKTGKTIPHWDVRSVFTPHSWYNHPICRNSQFHFLSCMTRNTLAKIGGFNESFKAGLSYDDDEFVSRIRKVVRCSTLPPDIGFGIHLWHTGGSTVLYSKNVEPVQTLTALNRKLYEELQNSETVYSPLGDYTNFGTTKTNKNVIIFGGKGMLGKYLVTYLKSQEFGITEFSRDDIDVEFATPKIIEELLTPHIKPNTVIINCIGKIPQKMESGIHNLKSFTKINTLFPIYLSLVVEKINGYSGVSSTQVRFIHITTDCVFSGNNTVLGGYLETDIADSLDVYGITKSMGETDKDTVIRTSIIGEEIYSKKSLLEWVKSNKNGCIYGYTTHYWNGVTCLELSKIIYNMLRQGIYWRGVRHIHTEKSVSKYQLVTHINEIWNLGIKIEQNKENAGSITNRTLRSSHSGCDKTLKVSGDIYHQLKQLKEYNITKDITLQI